MSVDARDRTSENSDRDDFWTVNAGESWTFGQVLERARLRVVAARDAATGRRRAGLRQVLNDALEDLDEVLDVLLTGPDVHGWHPDRTAEALRVVTRRETRERLTKVKGGAR